MMATTHVFAGLAAVAPLAVVAPEFATPLAFGAILGSLAPDLDLVLAHRRTFHFPVLGAVGAGVSGLGALFIPTVGTVAVAAFVLAAWLHAVTDAAGGGPEMDPWTNPTDRAVYDHLRGGWVRPRRWVRYDGSPEDAALAVALAIPSLVVFDGVVSGVVVAGLVVSIGYALVRRRVADLTPAWLE